MTKRPRLALWMGCAFAGALALAAITLGFLGPGASGTTVALRITARWSYLFFWSAYAGSALAQVFGPRFEPIARRGRQLGLAFAAAHLVHAALVVWLYHVSPRPPVPTSSLVFFGSALLVVYALALLSIPRIAAAIQPGMWRVVRLVGMEYIALAFLADFLRDPFHGGRLQLIAYLPFTALALVAPVLRLIAWLKRRHAAPLKIGETPIESTRLDAG